MRTRIASHLALAAAMIVAACATPRSGPAGAPAGDRGRTTAVSRITQADIERAGGTNLVALIESRLSGVRVVRVGNDYVVRIRGASSFQRSVDALVLVDGAEGTLGSVHPRDIASIEVLKDSAVAIYGARGANGVLLITTKQK
jgi:TonB-dependent SusC/RagA subfamily outer membrane receptor